MQKQVAIWCARFGWGKFGALGNLANKQFSWVGFSSLNPAQLTLSTLLSNICIYQCNN